MLKRPRQIGALVPSSAFLARAMVEILELKPDQRVLEIGPGTGVISQRIIAKISRPENYLGVEINEEFYQGLCRRFPQSRFVHGSAIDLKSILKQYNFENVEVVVSTLPWAIVPIGPRTKMLQEIKDAMKPDGLFCTFTYVPVLCMPHGLLFYRTLRKTFEKVVAEKIVWRNFPPAYVVCCQKVAGC